MDTIKEIRSQIKQEAKKCLWPRGHALWETINELSKEDKLKLLNSISRYYNGGGYICVVMCEKALAERFITAEQYDCIYCSLIANKLIPELYQFKPESVDIMDVWFGANLSGNAGKRRQVLKDLIELIEKGNDNN
jgi:hypothetical protein